MATVKLVRKKGEPGGSGLLMSLVIGLLAALAFYFTVRADIVLFLAARITMWIRAAGPGIVIACSVAACGLWLLPSSFSRKMGRLNTTLAALTIGVGPWSLAVLAAGIIGVLNSSVVLAFAAVALIAGFARWRMVFDGLGRPAFPGELKRVSPELLLLLAAVALLFMVALCPPLLFDVTEYHLGAWTSYFQPPHSARFLAMPWNFYARFPFPVESLYDSGLLIGAGYDAAPKVINACFVLAAALAAGSLARALGCLERFRVLVVLAALAHPVMQAVSLDAFIDAPVALFVVLSALLLVSPSTETVTGIEDVETDQGTELRVSALCLSIALASKYTTAQIFLFPWFILSGRHFVKLIRARRFGAVVGAITALCAVPVLWSLKNIGFYGNPLEPFFEKIFSPGNAGRIAREHFYILSHHPQAPWSAAYWQALLPRLAVLPPLLLAPLAGLLWGPIRKRVPAGGSLVLFCLASYGLWNLVGASEDRFLLGMMLILIALGITIISMLTNSCLRAALVTLFLVWSGTVLFQQGLKYAHGNVPGFLLESDFLPLNRKPADPSSPPGNVREKFLETNLGSIGTVTNAVNRRLPEDARLLLVFEARPWLIRRETACNTVWDQSRLLRIADGATTSGDIWTRLRKAGFTHVLVNREELRRYIQQYATPGQLARLGIPEKADHALAFEATPTPEDLFPPFYRDKNWKKLRKPVIAFLGEARARATVTAGPGNLSVFLAPVD